FFTSRRRHTRSKRDWSSDVCSSDLANPFQDATLANSPLENLANTDEETGMEQTIYQQLSKDRQDQAKALSEKIDASDSQSIVSRSEERRVGKETESGLRTSESTRQS